MFHLTGCDVTIMQLDSLHELVRDCGICVRADGCKITDASKGVRRVTEPVRPGGVVLVGQALGSRTQKLSGKPYRFVSGELSGNGKRLEELLNSFGFTLGDAADCRLAYSTDVVQC